MLEIGATERELSVGSNTICAGEFPGEAPQKTQIMVLGGEEEDKAVVFSESVTGEVVERTLPGLILERSWRAAGVERGVFPERIRGVDPSDAMIDRQIVEGDNELEEWRRKNDSYP